jgi:hypothetical protein
VRARTLSRVLALERARQARRPWCAPFIEQQPGQDISAELTAIERRARAAGWRPGNGPYVVIVELPELAGCAGIG